MATRTQTFRRYPGWAISLLLVAILTGVAALTAATLGQNQIPPAVVASGIFIGGSGFFVWMIPWLFRQDQGLGCFGVGFGLIVVFLGSAAAWRYVPTLTGWSNQRAEAVAERIVLELESYPPGRSNLPKVRQEWSQADEIAVSFPNLAPKLKQAQVSCAARFEKHLEKLRSGECSADEFKSRLPERRAVAEQYPEFRDRVPTDEFTWCEFQLRKLLTRLTALRSDERLQDPEQETVRSLLQQFPNLAANLASAEEDWLTRTEGTFVEAVHNLSPTDAEGFLTCSASCVGFLQRNTGRGKAIREAESDWYRRCEQAGLKEARRNLETEPVKAANELVATLDRLKKTSATDCFPPELKSELLRAARLSLDDAKRTTRVAIRADRYQAAARTANQLNLSLERAATLVGLKDELQEFCESCRFLAELAEQAGKSDPP